MMMFGIGYIRSKEEWWFFLANAVSAFNAGNCIACLWTARHRWPSNTWFSMNCYRYQALLMSCANHHHHTPLISTPTSPSPSNQPTLALQTLLNLPYDNHTTSTVSIHVTVFNYRKEPFPSNCISESFQTNNKVWKDLIFWRCEHKFIWSLISDILYLSFESINLFWGHDHVDCMSLSGGAYLAVAMM